MFIRTCAQIALFLGRTKIAVRDRKSTRLNSSHRQISYAVFCLENQDYHATSYANLDRGGDNLIVRYCPSPHHSSLWTLASYLSMCRPFVFVLDVSRPGHFQPRS